jgi:hypothetical protein
MSGQSDYRIVQAMERYGGSFARAIAQAAHRADENNLAKLKAAFPELWAEYAELAELSAKNIHEARSI